MTEDEEDNLELEYFKSQKFKDDLLEKINDGGQTEIWHNNSVVAILSKDVYVLKIN